jgi:dolichyl-phosphate beta-glucosyltransferase
MGSLQTTWSGMKLAVVIPCYNEHDRLDLLLVDRLMQGLKSLEPETTVLFVDDGSTDQTAAMLQGLAHSNSQISFLHLPKNVGKAEAVREGLNRSIADGAEIVGYCDADFATPPEEILRLISYAKDHPEYEAIIGSRVALAGYAIKRSHSRHYVGRLFATLSGAILGIGIYDTQCGAKWFHVSDALRKTLREPFVSRWGFDVEIFGRLLRSGVTIEQFREVPLDTWADVEGSKVTITSGLLTFIELAKIRRYLRRWS